MNESVCHLCGLTLRHGTVSHSANDQPLRFCCHGCRMVYTMLLESAAVDNPTRFRETDLYRQCVAAGVIPASEDDLRRIREREKQVTQTFANPVGGEKAASDRSGTLALDLMVDGMWCTACAWVIEKAVSRLPGVQTVACHFSTDRMRCRYRPDRVAPDQIRESVTRLGYGIRDNDAGTTGQQVQRRELIRLAITALLSANVMMLSWALYAGFFTTLDSDAVSKISLPIVAMAAVVFVYGGGPMLRKAWFGLIHRAPGMETLVGMGAGCAFVYSLYNWLTGSIHLYFDTACMLVTLVLLGKVLEQQAKGRVRQDLDSFFALQPAKVRLITEAWPTGRYVAIAHLEPGDRFAVEADEIVPADGRVESGTAALDESSLTGEPRAVPVKIGDSIKSGTRMIHGRVIARAEKIGENSVLGQMIAIMARSLEQKSPFETQTDRMLRWFVPVIITLAGGTGLFWAMAGLTMNQAVVRAVTVLVISCPCALGVAVPMARLAGISLAGRRGILVREIESFERAGGIDTVVFDKTGTLTHGRWKLNHIECQPGHDPATIAAWAAGLEQSSDHEIARSINAYTHVEGIAPALAAEISVHPDGVQGRLADKIVRIGNREFAWGAVPPPEGVTVESERTLTSRVYLGIDSLPAATLIFGDAIRPTVPSMVAALKRTSRDIHLVSGDGDAATREVARAIGLTQARGSLSPSDKATYIDTLKEQGRQVAMVGDGINDAAAMARSHLAVGVHSGQGLARQAAHITLMRGDPCQLLDFFSLSRQVHRKVSQNIWCAWIYNLISIPVAMNGMLTPLVAATAMLLSSLTVIGNTLLLVRRD
ncbi:heavy metal translocating P-type ATPase [Desulfosarcina sp.]|uniref:heavy metal translocating P-type ATPase n=1 Tax=Desulfosarcina sp. TaxID=2027861 RepID=UPI0039705874